MIKLDVNIPTRIYCSDYHEFSYIQSCFKLINKKIKCKELGFEFVTGDYIGLLYIEESDFKKEKQLFDRESKLASDEEYGE